MFTNDCRVSEDWYPASLEWAIEKVREYRSAWESSVEAANRRMPVCPKCGARAEISEDGSEVQMCEELLEVLRKEFRSTIEEPNLREGLMFSRMFGMRLNFYQCLPPEG